MLRHCGFEVIRHFAAVASNFSATFTLLVYAVIKVQLLAVFPFIFVQYSVIASSLLSAVFWIIFAMTVRWDRN